MDVPDSELPALPELPLLALPAVENTLLPELSNELVRSLNTTWRDSPAELPDLPRFGIPGELPELPDSLFPGSPEPGADPPRQMLPELATMQQPWADLPELPELEPSGFSSLPELPVGLEKHRDWSNFPDLPELNALRQRTPQDGPLLTSAWEAELPGPDFDELLPSHAELSSPGLPALTPVAFHASVEMAKSDAWDFNELPSVGDWGTEELPELNQSLSDFATNEASPLDKLSGLLSDIAQGISQLVQLADKPKQEIRAGLRYSSRYE